MSTIRICGWGNHEAKHREPAYPHAVPPFFPVPVRREASAAPSVRPIREQRAPASSAPGAPPRRESAHAAARDADRKDDLPAPECDCDDLWQPVVARADDSNVPDDGADNGQEFSRGSAGEVAMAAAISLDPAMLTDQLAPLAGDSGIFEVILPDGETLGVVVHVQPAQVSFLLNPSTGKLRHGLRRQQMELEGHLERRIGRNVKLTVL